MARDGSSESARCIAAGRNESYINILEGIVILQLAYNAFAPHYPITAPGTARRAEKGYLVTGEITLGKQLNKGLSYGTGSTNDSYFHCFSLF